MGAAVLECGAVPESRTMYSNVLKMIEKAYKVQQREMETRDAVNLRYNENTETLTFVVGQMADFMIKPDYDEEVKATLHVYWRQHNVYISSEYREGEHIQIVVYEDNYRIVHNENFYVTHGLKFTGEKGKTYTIRFVSGGKVEKLLAMEISQTTTKLENVASQNHLDNFNQRAQQVSLEIKVTVHVTVDSSCR